MPNKDPEARRAYHRAYFATHHAHIRKQQKASRTRHRKQRHAQDIRYRSRHPERVQARHARYRWTHRAERAEHCTRRRARKAKAPINDFTHAQWMEVQAAFEHCCAYCGKRAKGHLTQDHITPLSKGGAHTLANIVPACRSCNSKKHARKPLVPVQPLLLTMA